MSARRRLRPGARQLARLAEELAAACEGGVLQELRVAGPELLALAVRVPGETLRLGLSVHPEAAGPFLLPGKRPRRDAAAEEGTNFWLRLRASLPATSVERVRVPPGERTLVLELRRGAERLVLAAVFHGARPNLVLFEGEACVADLRGRVRKGSAFDDLLRDGPSGPPPDEDPSVSLREWSKRLIQERAVLLAAVRLESLAERLRKERAAAERRAQRQLDDAERLGETGELRRQAEALAAHLHEVVRGQAELSLPGWPDPDGDEPLTVPLDRTREPADNLDRLWQRVRKADRGRDEALARAEESENQAAALAELERRAEALGEGARAGEPQALESLDALEDEAEELLPAPKKRGAGKRKGEAPSLPYRRFTSADGLPILVGRSSKANDELSLRLAAGNDLWLHAQGVAGSHVVVRLPKGAEVPQETLLDAATLAHVHSKRKGDSHGEVVWTRAKHVSKRKGMPAGQVIVTQEKSLRVRVEPERLDRLKATEE